MRKPRALGKVSFATMERGSDIAAPSILDEQGASLYLGLPVRTLQFLRHNRRGPTYRKLGRAVRYLKEDLDSYLEATKVATQLR